MIRSPQSTSPSEKREADRSRRGRCPAAAACASALRLGLCLALISHGLGEDSANEPIHPQKIWNFQDASRTPDAWNGVSASENTEARTPDGESTLKLTAQVSSGDLEWPGFINCWTNLRDVPPGSQVRVTFWLRGPKGTTVDVGAVSERHFSLCERRSLPQTGEWQKADVFLPLRHQEGLRWVALPRITVRQAKAGEVIEIGPVNVTIIPPSRP